MVCVGENDLPSSMAVEIESVKVEMLNVECALNTGVLLPLSENGEGDPVAGVSVEATCQVSMLRHD